MKSASCSSCKFALQVPEVPNQVWCRRFPPYVIPHINGELVSHFPQMQLHGWCGEFRAALVEATEMPVELPPRSLS